MLNISKKMMRAFLLPPRSCAVIKLQFKYVCGNKKLAWSSKSATLLLMFSDGKIIGNSPKQQQKIEKIINFCAFYMISIQLLRFFSYRNHTYRLCRFVLSPDYCRSQMMI